MFVADYADMIILVFVDSLGSHIHWIMLTQQCLHMLVIVLHQYYSYVLNKDGIYTTPKETALNYYDLRGRQIPLEMGWESQKLKVC